jgi:Uma2 family endonuclease
VRLRLFAAAWLQRSVALQTARKLRLSPEIERDDDLSELLPPIVSYDAERRHLAGGDDAASQDAGVLGQDHPALALRNIDQLGILHRIDEERVVAQHPQPHGELADIVVDDELHNPRIAVQQLPLVRFRAGKESGPLDAMIGESISYTYSLAVRITSGSEMALASEQLTLEQFLRLAEEEPPLEYVEGEVAQKVSPKGRHSILQYTLAERINRFAQPRKLGYAIPELRITFGGASVVPDLVVYRWDRIAVDDEGNVADDFFEPPDIAIEIVSPEQSVNALNRRCIWCVAHGVHSALLVDPQDKSVLGFRPEQLPSVWRGSDQIDVTEALPDFELTVDELFGAMRMR